MTHLDPTEDAQLLERRRKREEFVARVREGERLAAADPARYRARVRGMVALGYGYIALVVVVTLALLAGLVALNVLKHTRVPVQFYIFLGLFLFSVVRSLPVKVERPKNPVVGRDEAPILYREVDAIADRLKAPRPDEIQIDARFNAAAAQYPRFGLFGPNLNVLILGLPYLVACEPDEMRSVVGHELGHFSGRHGRLGVAIYRIESTWHALYRNLRRSGRSDFVFRPFVDWYYPRLSAMTFAIRRQDEYEADASAAEATSPAVAARALLLGPARRTILTERFWNPFNRTLAQSGVPGDGYLAPLIEAGRSAIDSNPAQKATKETLAEATDYDDTHPSLTDRLRSLGVAPDRVEIGPLRGPSAAEAFLGDALPTVVRRVEDALRKDNEEGWRQYHKEQAGRQKRQETLVQTAESKPLSDKEAVELAALRANEADDLEGSREIFRALYESRPHSDRAAVYYGAALLDLDDPAGLPLVEERSRVDSSLREFALPRLGAYYARQGDAAGLERVRKEATEQQDRQGVAKASIPLRLNDDLLSPDLRADERERLIEQLREMPEVGRAYALRKRLAGTGEVRDYLFVLPRPKLEMKDEPQRLVNAVVKKVRFRGRTMVYCLEPRKQWRKRLDALPDALLYDRKSG